MDAPDVCEAGRNAHANEDLMAAARVQIASLAADQQQGG